MEAIWTFIPPFAIPHWNLKGVYVHHAFMIDSRGGLCRIPQQDVRYARNQLLAFFRYLDASKIVLWPWYISPLLSTTSDSPHPVDGFLSIMCLVVIDGRLLHKARTGSLRRHLLPSSIDTLQHFVFFCPGKLQAVGLLTHTSLSPSVSQSLQLLAASTTSHAIWCAHWATVFDNTLFLPENFATKAVHATRIAGEELTPIFDSVEQNAFNIFVSFVDCSSCVFPKFSSFSELGVPWVLFQQDVIQCKISFVIKGHILSASFAVLISFWSLEFFSGTSGSVLQAVNDYALSNNFTVKIKNGKFLILHIACSKAGVYRDKRNISDEKRKKTHNSSLTECPYLLRFSYKKKSKKYLPLPAYGENEHCHSHPVTPKNLASSHQGRMSLLPAEDATIAKTILENHAKSRCCGG
ncbi:hypothetical protein PHYBLDRAFT_146818 [Phycomyces blakesleeanus NRRL 1555(-)]|uniref:Uncharacterized protein n=1 Tax=Phycomyces blakesleeanus (strain ATCC 8743b / DSM 1359 / FGSC 10004 / NBRC 33097 / NRRL 1555) TaxID=763407 RepID=A0A167MEM7_PHYB8|nr:hypothetical protein PHYBLDRAFT_146818 [Phycomyces blakesleeanus NRRL 1555(-)]OAD72634.1 hypothetical protein PHYBLDRAFT_146818 [Phycomyces blakesleeanus NRRL 1555(-)]|eukprot:XP_018290674.1 hypothetical protein PHYBLDRAFT_146818 [Phycomyces blakesleeanus NRRL 1555(-)]